MQKLPPGKIIYHHVSAETLYALNIVDREVPAAEKNLMEFCDLSLDAKCAYQDHKTQEVNVAYFERMSKYMHVPYYIL